MLVEPGWGPGDKLTLGQQQRCLVVCWAVLGRASPADWGRWCSSSVQHWLIYLQCCVCCWTPQAGRDGDLLSWAYWWLSIMMNMKKLGHLTYRERFEITGIVQPAAEEAQESLNQGVWSPEMQEVRGDGARLFSLVPRGWPRGNGHKLK